MRRGRPVDPIAYGSLNYASRVPHSGARGQNIDDRRTMGSLYDWELIEELNRKEKGTSNETSKPNAREYPSAR